MIMNNIIKDAIKSGFNGIALDNVLMSIRTKGWTDGYKWILDELSARGKISQEDLKHYMNALN